MKANEVIDIFNRFDIDWCYTCAGPVIKHSKQKMFAWIVLNLMRLMGHSNYKTIECTDADDQLKLVIDLSLLTENDAIQKYLYRISYWKFLNHLLTVQLDNWDIHEFEIAEQFQIDKRRQAIYITIRRKKA